ncbi:MAG: hypothetical protein ACT6RN_20940 [Agrobacterium sp.]
MNWYRPAKKSEDPPIPACAINARLSGSGVTIAHIRRAIVTSDA